MVCSSTKDIDYDPVWASELKNTTEEELHSLVEYATGMREWMVELGLHTSTEEVIMMRAGLPNAMTEEELESRALYVEDGNVGQLIKAVSIDAIKVTKRVNHNNRVYSQPYTFKSRFTHAIYDTYFYDGVTNKTGFEYLDTVDINLSALAPIPAQYGGTVAIQLPPEPLPAVVYNCLTYLAQNNDMFKVSSDEVVTATATTDAKYGDVIYYRTDEFYVHLGNMITKANTTIGNLATPYEEDIMEVLTYLGMDQSFKDLEYGGNLDELRLAIRIPASRANQDALQFMLGPDDVWDEVFIEEFIYMDDKEARAAAFADDLADPWNEDKTGEYSKLDTMDYYGCRVAPYVVLPEGSVVDGEVVGSGVTSMIGVYRRYWYVHDEWFKGLTPEQISIIFWMGLDLVTDYKLPRCDVDKIIMIVIVIAVTYFSLGMLGPEANALMVALIISSAIVSIAGIVGAITPEQAKKAGIVLAIATAGASLYTSLATSGTIALKQVALECMQLISVVVDAISYAEQQKFEKEQEDILDETEQLTEDAELYESTMRLSYGAVYDMPVRNGPEADPYKYMKDTYDSYSSFSVNETGFMNG